MAGKKRDRSMYRNAPKNEGPNDVVDMRLNRKSKRKTEYPKDITENFEELEADVISVTEATEKYNIVAKDPYHHCFIEGPNLPASLQGAYTTYTAAKTALDEWLATKGN